MRHTIRDTLRSWTGKCYSSGQPVPMWACRSQAETAHGKGNFCPPISNGFKRDFGSSRKASSSSNTLPGQSCRTLPFSHLYPGTAGPTANRYGQNDALATDLTVPPPEFSRDAAWRWSAP